MNARTDVAYCDGCNEAFALSLLIAGRDALVLTGRDSHRWPFAQGISGARSAFVQSALERLLAESRHWDGLEPGTLTFPENDENAGALSRTE